QKTGKSSARYVILRDSNLARLSASRRDSGPGGGIRTSGRAVPNSDIIDTRPPAARTAQHIFHPAEEVLRDSPPPEQSRSRARVSGPPSGRWRSDAISESRSFHA